MAKTHDLAVVIGEYTARDGSTKKSWRNIGEMHEGEKGPYLLMDPFFNLAAIQREPGKDRVRVGLFTPKAKDKQGGGQREAPKAARPAVDPEFDDGLPFVWAIALPFLPLLMGVADVGQNML